MDHDRLVIGLPTGHFNLLSLAKDRMVGVIGKSGSETAALQIASSQYYAGVSRCLVSELPRSNPSNRYQQATLRVFASVPVELKLAGETD